MKDRMARWIVDHIGDILVYYALAAWAYVGIRALIDIFGGM